MKHQSVEKKDLTNRLKRVSGQVLSIVRLIEKDASCEDILVQLSACKASLTSVGRLVLEDYFHECVKDAAAKGDERAAGDYETALKRFTSLGK